MSIVKSAFGNVIQRVNTLEQNLVHFSSVNDLISAIETKAKKFSTDFDIYNLYVAGPASNGTAGTINFLANPITLSIGYFINNTTFMFNEVLPLTKNQQVFVSGELSEYETLEGYTSGVPRNYFVIADFPISDTDTSFQLSLTKDGPAITGLAPNGTFDSLSFMLYPSKWIEENGIRIFYEHDEASGTYPLYLTLNTFDGYTTNTITFTIQKNESVTLFGGSSRRKISMTLLPPLKFGPGWNGSGLITESSTSSSSITAEFNVSLLTATEPIVFEYGFSEIDGGGENGYTFSDSFVSTIDNVYQFEMNSLTSNTTYYFVAKATNAYGSAISQQAEIATGDGGGGGGDDVLSWGSSGQISITNYTSTSVSGSVSTENVNGAFSHVDIGYSLSQSDFTYVGANFDSGTTYIFTIDELSSSTLYYFVAKVINTSNGLEDVGPSASQQTSDSGGGGGGGQAPQWGQSSAVINGLFATSSSISGGFDVSDVTGDAPISYTIGYYLNNLPYTFSSDIVPIEYNICNFEITGLNSNSLYTLVAKASNQYGENLSQSESFQTLIQIDSPNWNNAANSGISFSGTTSDSISGTFSVGQVTGTQPITYSVVYSSSNDLSSPSYLTIGDGLYLENGAYLFVASNLSANSEYFFKLIASNEGGTTYGLLDSNSTMPAEE